MQKNKQTLAYFEKRVTAHSLQHFKPSGRPRNFDNVNRQLGKGKHTPNIVTLL